MRVLVSLEQRYLRTPDGRVWTATSHPYGFWTRYLDVFDQVDVLARVLEVKRAEPKWTQANGAGVNFVAVPHFFGPHEYARRMLKVGRAIAGAVPKAEAVIMRVPSLVGQMLAVELKRTGHPFGLEVVGDPYDVFAPGSGILHPLRPFFRWWFSSNMRRQCKDAKAVTYVTHGALQRRYPSQANMLGISDVELPKSAFRTSYSSVEFKSQQRSILVFVGTLEQLYKAPDVLIKATAQAIARGCNLQLQIVGDGRYKGALQQLAQALGIADRCNFHGQLTCGEIQDVLDRSHLFVLPSRAEGLPRALIEAMARRLPCIGSPVGGIPELLDSACLVPAGCVDALAAKIEELIADPQKREAAAKRNVREAQKYCEDVLRLKRIEFYRSVRGFTADWLRKP